MEKVFVVLKNADFTEGRGPMLLHAIFSKFKDAEDYILAQPGIMGSPQNIQENAYLLGDTLTWSYNGYKIEQWKVATEYNAKKIREHKEYIENLEIELEKAKKELKEMSYG